jgi:hypothetical protein
VSVILWISFPRSQQCNKNNRLNKLIYLMNLFFKRSLLGQPSLLLFSINQFSNQILSEIEMNKDSKVGSGNLWNTNRSLQYTKSAMTRMNDITVFDIQKYNYIYHLHFYFNLALRLILIQSLGTILDFYGRGRIMFWKDGFRFNSLTNKIKIIHFLPI